MPIMKDQSSERRFHICVGDKILEVTEHQARVIYGKIGILLDDMRCPDFTPCVTYTDAEDK